MGGVLLHQPGKKKKKIQPSCGFTNYLVSMITVSSHMGIVTVV